MGEKWLVKIRYKLHVKVKKCVKKHACVFFFPNQS